MPARPPSPFAHPGPAVAAGLLVAAAGGAALLAREVWPDATAGWPAWTATLVRFGPLAGHALFAAVVVAQLREWLRARRHAADLDRLDARNWKRDPNWATAAIQWPLDRLGGRAIPAEKVKAVRAAGARLREQGVKRWQVYQLVALSPVLVASAGVHYGFNPAARDALVTAAGVGVVESVFGWLLVAWAYNWVWQELLDDWLEKADELAAGRVRATPPPDDPAEDDYPPPRGSPPADDAYAPAPRGTVRAYSAEYDTQYEDDEAVGQPLSDEPVYDDPPPGYGTAEPDADDDYSPKPPPRPGPKEE